MLLTFQFLREEKPGDVWKNLFQNFWPAYKHWFLSEGELARPGYSTSSHQLQQYMPELFPIYEQLVELSEEGDLAARFLSQYCPPPYLTGCSQLIWTENSPYLLRNYDYDPRLFEGTIFYSNWLRPVIAVVDSIWGVLDGINDAGLTVALSFGGRKYVDRGFGITLLLRYLLETCEKVEDAIDRLDSIPIHMPYNISLVDADGNLATVFLAPDRDPVVSETPICTNHQTKIEWEYYAQQSGTLERHKQLEMHLKSPEANLTYLTKKFLQPPLYMSDYKRGMGTLYTSVYNAENKSVDFIWPGRSIYQNFDAFEEHHIKINVLGTLKSRLSK